MLEDNPFSYASAYRFTETTRAYGLTLSQIDRFLGM
jgi:hypothetical protein